MQEVEAPEVTVVGEQATEDSTAGATRFRVAVFELPFKVALSCAAASAPMAATVAVKPTLVWPAAMETVGETVTLALLLLNATAAPPFGAACVRLTVQAEVPGAVTEVGVQLRLLNCASGATVTVTVWLTPPADAVMTTGVELATELAVAEKGALTAPAATVTEAGTVRAALLLLNVTG